MVSASSGIEQVHRLPVWLTDEYLTENGQVAVATGDIHHNLYPGVQTGVAVGYDGMIRANDTGLVVGSSNLHHTATRVLQQVAYRAGMPPGHGGGHYTPDGRDVEPLASTDLKNLLRRSRGNHIGYLCLADRNAFDEERPVEFGAHAVATRKTMPVRTIIGVTAADLAALLGPGGFDALRDSPDHPQVRQHLQRYGIRPECF